MPSWFGCSIAIHAVEPGAEIDVEALRAASRRRWRWKRARPGHGETAEREWAAVVSPRRTCR